MRLNRFRYFAGRLFFRRRKWILARLTKVLAAMGEAGIVWDPTFNIYEASRDVSRAQISHGSSFTCIRAGEILRAEP
jgi:hypothetical protein